MKKNKITGIIGTLVLHVLILGILLLVAISRPNPQEEGGVPVMMGNTDLSGSEADPYTLTDVDVLAEAEEPAEDTWEPEVLPEPETPVKEQLITQADEKTVVVPEKKPKQEKKKVTPPKKKVEKKDGKKVTPKKDPTPVKKEKTEEEKKKEAARIAAEKKAAEEKAAAAKAAKNIAGAFGKGTKMGSKGQQSTGKGIQGSPSGNSSEGKSTGVGGYGSFDLNGRSLGPGGLPRPVYNVQDEGRVVVTIVVNPAGQVISTRINKRTNTVNTALRRAAEEAARKARFNKVGGVNNQTGTITYYFKLR